MPQPAVLFPALSGGGSPVSSHQPHSETKARVARPVHAATSNKGLRLLLALTEPFQGISHGLVFHHVNEPPSQAEVREDQEHRLQDIIDVIQLLKKK